MIFRLANSSLARLCRKAAGAFMLLLLSLVLLAAGALQAKEGVPARPNPPRLVNDIAAILTQEQRATLEFRLDTFAKKTSNQIAVVIVPELYGYEVSELAVRIGLEWGVGKKDLNSGVVMLIKPKNGNGRGEVFIATGYGAEVVLTDAQCSKIINKYLIPGFKKNDYYSGISDALDYMIPLLAGEISVEEDEEESPLAVLFGVFILVILVILLLVIVFGNNQNNMGGGDGKGGGKRLSTAESILLATLLSNSGRGSFGGSRSSGGGFGGGSFGGGGAGGSW